MGKGVPSSLHCATTPILINFFSPVVRFYYPLEVVHPSIIIDPSSSIHHHHHHQPSSIIGRESAL